MSVLDNLKVLEKAMEIPIFPFPKFQLCDEIHPCKVKIWIDPKRFY